MEIDQIIAKCYELYPPGTHVLNARHKWNKANDDPFQADAYSMITINEDTKFEHYDVQAYQDGKIAIVARGATSNSGVIYCMGTWADICDKHKNIIKVIEDPFDLDNVRKWLWK